MSAPSTGPKVLLTTAYKKDPNQFYHLTGANCQHLPRFEIICNTSTSLRFIKQNVPEIEILEFPTWEEYVLRLKEGWDAVGFTFFHHELGEVLKMAAQARSLGVKEIWAGGYGGLSDEIEGVADRIFKGYVEAELAEEFFSRKLERITHPPIVLPLNLNLPPIMSYKKIGVLYTQRGCPYRCTFCQTPAHCARPFRVPLESIEEVLRYWRSRGINELVIADETFYTFPSHSESVIDLLDRYRFHWWVMTRAAICLKRLDDWAARGMGLVAFGLESVNDAILERMGKKINLEFIREFSRRTAERKIFTLPYYMLGYEEDTAESIMRDLVTLRNLKFDFYQLTVLTPYPKTPLWYELSSHYGIFEKDYHKFDARHLVWNHPSISPSQMRYLLCKARAVLNTPMGYFGRGALSVARRRIREKGMRFVWEDVLRPPSQSLAYNERKNVTLD